MLSNGVGRSQCKKLKFFHRVIANKGDSPSDPSATIRLLVYASFEFQPMLGNGEQLRSLTTTLDELLHRSANHLRE